MWVSTDEHIRMGVDSYPSSVIPTMRGVDFLAHRTKGRPSPYSFCWPWIHSRGAAFAVCRHVVVCLICEREAGIPPVMVAEMTLEAGFI